MVQKTSRNAQGKQMNQLVGAGGNTLQKEIITENAMEMYSIKTHTMYITGLKPLKLLAYYSLLSKCILVFIWSISEIQY
jgi:hypothetical protein